MKAEKFASFFTHVTLTGEDLAVFRTRICIEHRRGNCKNPDHCPNSHCQSWQRRNPFEYPYSAKLCSDIKFVVQNNKMTLVRRCSRGRACFFAHSKEEELYHPNLYKKKPCSFHPNCTRYYCPFVHGSEEISSGGQATFFLTRGLPSLDSMTSSNRRCRDRNFGGSLELMISDKRNSKMVDKRLKNNAISLWTTDAANSLRLINNEVADATNSEEFSKGAQQNKLPGYLTNKNVKLNFSQSDTQDFLTAIPLLCEQKLEKNYKAQYALTNVCHSNRIRDQDSKIFSSTETLFLNSKQKADLDSEFNNDCEALESRSLCIAARNTDEVETPIEMQLKRHTSWTLTSNILQDELGSPIGTFHMAPPERGDTKNTDSKHEHFPSGIGQNTTENTQDMKVLASPEFYIFSNTPALAMQEEQIRKYINDTKSLQEQTLDELDALFTGRVKRLIDADSCSANDSMTLSECSENFRNYSQSFNYCNNDCSDSNGNESIETERHMDLEYLNLLMRESDFAQQPNALSMNQKMMLFLRNDLKSQASSTTASSLASPIISSNSSIKNSLETNEYVASKSLLNSDDPPIEDTLSAELWHATHKSMDQSVRYDTHDPSCPPSGNVNTLPTQENYLSDNTSFNVLNFCHAESNNQQDVKKKSWKMISVQANEAPFSSEKSSSGIHTQRMCSGLEKSQDEDNQLFQYLENMISRRASSWMGPTDYDRQLTPQMTIPATKFEHVQKDQSGTDERRNDGIFSPCHISPTNFSGLS